MGRLALTLFPLVLIFIICGHLILRTNATFFVELHDRNGESNVIISLYECNAPPSVVRSQPTETSAVALPPSYTTNQDISCGAVVSERRKQEIYSTANFFMVVDLRRGDGRRIILRSRSAELPPPTIFVGVSTVGGVPADYPALLRNLNESYRNRLRHKCLVTLPARFLRDDMNFEALVSYMGIADFYQIAWPDDTRYISFARIVRRVQDLYNNKVVNARQNRVSVLEEEQAQNDVKSAIRLLIPKLIDPCFVLANFRDKDVPIMREGVPMDPMEVATDMCDSHCQLLRATSLIYPHAPKCGLALGGGTCVGRVCMCEKKKKKFGCVAGANLGTMINCSNEIRIGFAGFINMGV